MGLQELQVLNVFLYCKKKSFTSGFTTILSIEDEEDDMPRLAVQVSCYGARRIESSATLDQNERGPHRLLLRNFYGTVKERTTAVTSLSQVWHQTFFPVPLPPSKVS